MVHRISSNLQMQKFDLDTLQSKLESVIGRNFVARISARDLLKKEDISQQQILQVLREEISGPIICALDTLNPQLVRLKVLKGRYEETLVTWLAMNFLVIEYKALWKSIDNDCPTWDTSNVWDNSQQLLQELIGINLKFEDHLLLQIRMSSLRVESQEKVKPHLGAPWPKIAETSAINQYIDLIKFQIGCIQQKLRVCETEVKSLEKVEKKFAKMYKNLEKEDKFGKRSLLACWSKKRPLTASNLHIWEFSPDTPALSYQLPEVSSQIRTEASGESAAQEVARRSTMHVWRFLGEAKWRLPGQMVKLAHHLQDVEKRLVEKQEKLDELELVVQQLKKVKNEKNLLHHELARNRKFLTQILLEKLVNENQTLKQLRVSTRYPQSEDPVVQELVQKNLVLEHQVQALERVVEYNREEAARHKERSCSITNSLNNAINSLEQIAVMFILHERTDQQLVLKLRSIVQTDDHLQGLVGMLNKEDLSVLQESLQKGNVDQVLSDLVEDLDRQQSAFRALMQQLGPEGLAVAIRHLPAAQVDALLEAVADERLDTTTELLRRAKPDAIDLSEDQVAEDRVTRVVSQLHQLLERIA
ncbi:uncharacterized protein LOC132194667 [Neocloeon triangulifer]|uniref:uncharacterized protein LOC132194667 n=1 Tax=Neocloeon triangulifer TaxID=2078957 RepID=UPI00286F51C6|nr:uncharacterized protein LOC132194667 [Neocloeon triangulifer]